MNRRRWFSAGLLLIIGVLILYWLRPTPTSDFWYKVTYVLIPSSLVAVIVALRRYTLYTVRTGEIAIVERAGRFCSVATPGLVLLIPFLESIRIFPTTEQRCECDEKDLLTRDGVAISINMAVHYQLQEPVSETVLQIAYTLPAWETTVQKQAKIALHQQIGSMTSDEIMQTWPYLGEKIKNNLQSVTQDWGIRITAIQLFNLRIPEDLRKALEDSRQAEIEAKTVEYRAGGEAERLRQIAESLRNCTWLDGVLTERYIEALERMSTNPASHIVLPIEILRVLKALGADSSLLGKAESSNTEASNRSSPELQSPDSKEI